MARVRAFVKLKNYDNQQVYFDEELLAKSLATDRFFVFERKDEKGNYKQIAINIDEIIIIDFKEEVNDF